MTRSPAVEWIYERSDDDLARFVLGTTGENPLVCVGLNPSTATPSRLDPTLKRVVKAAATSGHDSVLMLNLYALRATDPRMLPRTPDPELTAANEAHIARAIDGRALTVWAAWGALIATRSYLPGLLIDLARLPALARCRWHSRGPLTMAGHPRHPLYVRDAEPLVPFDLDAYCAALVR